MKKFIAIVGAIAAISSCKADKAAESSSGAAKGNASNTTSAPAKISGKIAVDGSSTVFPISEAVAEKFQEGNKTKVPVSQSGTGGGFKKFCDKRISVTGASRPIKQKEIDACKANGVSFIELPVAYDGIAVVVNTKNTWVDAMTVAELKKLWEPEAKGTIVNWSDVRDGWPKQPVRLLGPGPDSGTFDYFTKAIVGKERASRSDYMPNEDDSVLVKGVAGDTNALGYFGYAYYAENKDTLKIVHVKNGEGAAIAASMQSIADGSYQPLSRPIFIYVSADEAKKAEVKAFVEFYLTEGRELISEVGYVALPDKVYELGLKRFQAGTTGSLFTGSGSKVGMTVEELMSK